jgi:hypothetical protein
MNEVKMEDEPLQEIEKNTNVQTKGSKHPKDNEEKLKENFKMKAKMSLN